MDHGWRVCGFQWCGKFKTKYVGTRPWRDIHKWGSVSLCVCGQCQDLEVGVICFLGILDKMEWNCSLRFSFFLSLSLFLFWNLPARPRGFPRPVYNCCTICPFVHLFSCVLDLSLHLFFRNIMDTHIISLCVWRRRWTGLQGFQHLYSCEALTSDRTPIIICHILLQYLSFCFSDILNTVLNS